MSACLTALKFCQVYLIKWLVNVFSMCKALSLLFCSCSSSPLDAIFLANVTFMVSASWVSVMQNCFCFLENVVFIEINFCIFPDQEERTKAIEAFKEGKKDVLVATDVASKGLDFPAIQHVVNYDMPEEIENYGKRIICIWLYLHHVFVSSSKISQADLTKFSRFSP